MSHKTLSYRRRLDIALLSSIVAPGKWKQNKDKKLFRFAVVVDFRYLKGQYQETEVITRLTHYVLLLNLLPVCEQSLTEHIPLHLQVINPSSDCRCYMGYHGTHVSARVQVCSANRCSRVVYTFWG